MATDADAVRAACRRPSFTTGLGFRARVAPAALPPLTG